MRREGSGVSRSAHTAHEARGKAVKRVEMWRLESVAEIESTRGAQTKAQTQLECSQHGTPGVPHALLRWPAAACSYQGTCGQPRGTEPSPCEFEAEGFRAGVSQEEKEAEGAKQERLVSEVRRGVTNKKRRESVEMREWVGVKRWWLRSCYLTSDDGKFETGLETNNEMKREIDDGINESDGNTLYTGEPVYDALEMGANMRNGKNREGQDTITDDWESSSKSNGDALSNAGSDGVLRVAKGWWVCAIKGWSEIQEIDQTEKNLRRSTQG
ncbi:hypothetical protein EDB83DRAFT_2322216 [Lactarius deliciosus]|nr:hypothetical protein EDB83DRAFT_2322216 [Lactarius deliciosus]